MGWVPLALSLALAAAAADEGALASVADGVAVRLGAPEEGRRGLALALNPTPPALGPPLAAALAGALGRAGWAVSPVPAGPGARTAARAVGADWLLTLTAGASGDGRELVAVGEASALWESFFLQARPAVPAAPPRLVSSRAVADAPALLLLRGAGPAPLPRYQLRTLARLPWPVVAIGAGEVEGTGPALLVVCPDAVRLLDRSGAELAARPIDAEGRRPVRAPAAAAVVAPLGGGPLGVALAGAAGGEVLSRRGARLEQAGALPMAPLAAGEAGVLFGAFAPGKGALLDLVSLGVDAAVEPRSGRELVAAAAAPRRGSPAFALLHPGGRLELLDAALRPAGELGGVGAGFALADLDGDGIAEVVASASGTGESDQVRVLGIPAPVQGSTPAVLWASPPIAGAIYAAAAADLTGDGLDDVVLVVTPPCTTQPCPATLLLLTLDPAEAR